MGPDVIQMKWLRKRPVALFRMYFFTLSHRDSLVQATAKRPDLISTLEFREIDPILKAFHDAKMNKMT